VSVWQAVTETEKRENKQSYETLEEIFEMLKSEEVASFRPRPTSWGTLQAPSASLDIRGTGNLIISHLAWSTQAFL
jgi:hypothetical protein